MVIEQRLEAALDDRRAASMLRRRVVRAPAGMPLCRVGNEELINFCSNDYLGLSGHPAVVEAAGDALQHYGLGSGGSSLVSGYTAAHAELEEQLAVFCRRERALVFPAGYLANLGVVSALAGHGDAVYQDRLNHASLIDAALLSRARLHRYRHASPDALAERLAASKAPHRLVVTDGVFSMDGDIAPLAQVAAVCRAGAALLMVDDAHGIGVLGASGGGTLEHLGLNAAEVPVLIGTFGKAFGGSGAFIAASALIIETLIQTARPYIYSTAMPPAMAAGMLTALQIVREGQQRREHLHTLIAFFRKAAASRGLQFLPSMTPIQPFVVGGAFDTVALSDQLRAAGFLVTPIRPPTVPKGSARLRITLCALHQTAHIEALLDALQRASEALQTPGRQQQ